MSNIVDGDRGDHCVKWSANFVLPARVAQVGLNETHPGRVLNKPCLRLLEHCFRKVLQDDGALRQYFEDLA
jgi:hypothetical protein